MLTEPTREFLDNTNRAYNECSHGIYALDRIALNVSEQLAPTARLYLLPMVYAYWERFFRITFSEFVRCLALSRVSVMEVNKAFGKYALRRQISASLKKKISKKFLDVPDDLDIEIASKHFRGIADWFALPLNCEPATDWVETHANVNCKVLKNNCSNLGVNFNYINDSISSKGGALFKKLNSLVDERNNIAHGKTVGSITRDEWEDYKNFTLDLMNTVQMALHETISNRQVALSSKLHT